MLWRVSFRPRPGTSWLGNLGFSSLKLWTLRCGAEGILRVDFTKKRYLEGDLVDRLGYVFSSYGVVI